MLDVTRLQIRHIARWKNNMIMTLGMVELFLGFVLLIPALVALYYGEDTMIFLMLSPILLAIGSFQYLLFSSDKKMAPALGILMMSFAWLIAFLVVSMPYLFYGFQWYDALFESVSGFTTTGSTIVSDVETLPHSLLFWRSFSQWVGGIAVVIVFMFLLPMMGVGGRIFVNNELNGTDIANYSVRMKNVAISFIYIYILFTVLEIVLLLFAGVSPFESVCITLSNISTGGMMVKNDSIGSYSFVVQLIVLIFMFLGGTNFYLHYRMLYKRDYKAYFKSQEFVWTFIWFTIASMLVIIAVVKGTGMDITANDFGRIIWESIFSVVSIGTSTGYSIFDYSLWPALASVVLWFCGILGAMSGSTAGGMKIYRIIILKSYVSYGFYKMLHPNAIRDVKFNKNSISSDTLMLTIVIIVSFLLVGTGATVTFLLLEPGIEIGDALGLSVASIGNVGLGFGHYGPSGSMANLQVATKLLICALMWIGRLEVFMVVLLFTRSFWKDILINSKHIQHIEDKKSLRDYARLKK